MVTAGLIFSMITRIIPELGSIHMKILRLLISYLENVCMIIPVNCLRFTRGMF